MSIIKLKSKLLLFSILFLLFTSTIKGQLSQKHYIPPLTYADEGNANPQEQYIYISTPSPRNVTFTIQEVGSKAIPQVRTVTKNNPQEIFIGSGDGQLFVAPSFTSTVHNDKGYIIEASGGQIYVSIRVRAGNSAQAGALVSKGAAALGKVFRAGMFTNEAPQSNYLNFISVMAAEDNTTVTFKDLPDGILIENSTNGPNVPNITLNEGESYILATNALDAAVNTDGLIGTLIESDKNIVVNTGSANGSFGGGNGRDYGLDQIVDVAKVGTKYIFVRGSGSDAWENVLIVAHEDDTTVNVAGNAVAVINAGDFYVIEGDNYSAEENMFVQTSKPAFAYQGVGGLSDTGGPSEANQGMFFVPPLSCESRGNVDNIAQIDRIGGTTFGGGVTIVTNKDATILVNGQAISNFNPIGPNAVTGNKNYVTYKITGLSGNISVESSEELYCAYFNQNGAATSGSFYSGFLTAPEVNFDTTIATLGSCIPNVTLESANTDLFDSLQWQKLSETTNIWNTVESTPTFKPTTPGRYRLVGKINCNPNEEFISSEIPVSICPDDFDGDLIIDNIDVDLDNDGILNSDESFGDITIDLSNINKPIANNPLDNSNIIKTTVYDTKVAGNSISGTSSGDFTSTLISDPLTSASYTINFTQDLNIELQQSPNQNHVISLEEYFIIKIGPNDKNITLLDPDDQLLVNTSFDLNQEFSSGITNISASEIWFKYKTNVDAGKNTFKFVANKVDQIIFEHKSNGITSNSTFNGTIKITCFAKDSDGDGIEDAFDNDSDNDGIPDFFESIAISGVSLSNTDANEDGLDDVFDTNTPNQDTDNDGIPNSLDLDADNDGIYDLIEAGLNSNLDSNNDGIIDDANTNSGTNGLYNPLENIVDSSEINYTIKNSDANTEVETNRDNLFDFIDLDADGDDCFDTVEAGFTDNGSGRLAPNPLDIDINGKVNNSDGYTTPNINYNTSAPILLNTPFESFIVCENSVDVISIDSNADRFAWEVSNDNGVNFTPITNDATYTINQNGLTISNIPIGFNNNIYKVILEKNGNSCSKEHTATLTVNEIPTPNPITKINECASDPNTTTTNLSNAEINIINNPKNYDFTYFITEIDAINGTNQLTEEEYQAYELTVNVSRNAWVKTRDKTTSCSAISEIQATATFTPNVDFNDTIATCDDEFFVDKNGNETSSDKDGISSFNFTEVANTILDEITTKQPNLNRDDLEVLFFENESDRDATINTIITIDNYRNADRDNQIIYVKINNKNNNDCQGIGEFPIQVNPLPEFEVTGEAPDKPQLLCLNDVSINLEVENPKANDYSYTWTNEDGNEIGTGNNVDVFAGGNYTVTATIVVTGCTRSRTITVEESDLVTLDNSFITINDNLVNPIENNLSISIDVTKIGLIADDYLYALARENNTIVYEYQEEPAFKNLDGNIYKVLIENKDGCGNSEALISIVEIPKFFTPNNDGKNDTWNVKGVSASFYSTIDVKIFNRFGKLIYMIKKSDNGWDGTYNGVSLPEDDYWYTITLIPTDTSKQPFQKTGHFSLIKKI